MSSRVKKMRAIPSMGLLQNENRQLRDEIETLKVNISNLRRKLDAAHETISLHERLRGRKGLAAVAGHSPANPRDPWQIVASISLHGATPVTAKGSHIIVKETLTRCLDQINILLVNAQPEHTYSYVSGVTVELKGPDKFNKASISSR